jgi:hypothetical protein
MSMTPAQSIPGRPQATWSRRKEARVSRRKQMLYLGLAAMEACWLYPWLLFALGVDERAAHVPFAPILFTLLLAFCVTRYFDRRAVSLAWQRLCTIVLALLCTFLLLRIYVYPSYLPTDFSWAARFIWELGNVLQRIHGSFVLTLASLLLWWRGIQLAQRDLGLHSIGFSFRVGIIAFLWLFLCGLFGLRIDASPFAFGYFALGLVVLGLARIEEVGSTRLGICSPFDASWTALLTVAALLVVALSLVAARVLSVQNIVALLRQLRPAIALLSRAASPLLVALAWLLELLLTTLIRIFGAALGERPESQAVEGLSSWIEELRRLRGATAPQGLWATIVQVLKWGFLGLIMVGVLAAIALSISRIRRGTEDGRNAEFESVWDSSSAGKDVRNALQSRWMRWREELWDRLTWLRGEQYSLTTIRHIYASLVKLAAASGLARQAAETPYEYLARLEMVFPGSEPEMELITEAYVQAHYGERSFSPRYVQQVRDAWLTVRTRQEHDDRG